VSVAGRASGNRTSGYRKRGGSSFDGCEAWDDNEPYTLNLGGGTGYAFLSEDGLEGRFYWDSV
jgi:hypothetical protein